jgi:hypothetical protein
MRHSTSAHLLGIPDLPEDAFKHVGDRKIKPQGLWDALNYITGGAANEASDKVKEELKQAGDWIDQTVKDIIPGGWTTLAEVGIALTPAGALGAAAFGGLSGATGGFKKKGFDLQGAIIGGLQGYGVGSLTTSLASAGAPAANPYGSGANYDISTATRPYSTEIGNFAPADYSLSSAAPSASGAGASGATNYSLSSGASGAGASSAGAGLNPYATAGRSVASEGLGSGLASTVNAPGAFQSPDFGQLPTGGETELLADQFPTRAATPSAMQNLGSGMAETASQAGQGIKNLVGLGPQGLSGIMPAASAVNAGMGYTAYAGLGLVALEEAAKRNQDDHDQGKITDQQYLENQRMINESIAASRNAVNQYRYEPDPEPTQEQETLYAKPRRTLYDQYAQNEPTGLNNMYASGGSVSDYETPDTLMAGGITNAFNFNSGGQMPMYASGGVLKAVVRSGAEKIAADQAAAKAAAEKPMKDFRYEPIAELQSNSLPLDYKDLGSLLYAQKKMSRLGYAGGGEARFLSGGGDGMSDSIKASIDGKQEARLADGEFVIPADVVSHLGNGSSKAGAKQLYAMMERVRKARTGNRKQGKQINPTKFMPA